LVDGVFVPLSEIYPKFCDEEISRAIKIPLGEETDPRLDEILGLIAENPEVYLVTGHVSTEEAVKLVDLSQKFEIKNVVVSSAVTKISPIDVLKKMAEYAFIEFTLAAYTHTTSIPKTHYYVEREYASIDEGMKEGPGAGVKEVAEQIRELGAENCIISTDFGVYTLPTPVEGLREFIACLLDLGIEEKEITQVVKSNPEKLLGLS
jgi:hypothetical protein